MVMTILEARVSPAKWAALEQAYQEGAQHRDAGLVQSFLIQSSKEDNLWRILTIWSSRQALDAMRSTGETPRGILIFRAAGAEPVLSIFTIAQQIDPE
jgi:quinol monooxygenase YgiN